MKHIHTFESFLNEGKANQDIKVGDTVGNAVQGFNFEVKKISGDKMTVKDKKSGKEFETFIENMYKSSNESLLNEGVITPMQMEMNGKKLINKISDGAKFEGTFQTRPETFTVVGFGDSANAFKIFEVEDSAGKKLYLKVSVMYGCSYQVMDNPRGNWDSAQMFNLKNIII